MKSYNEYMNNIVVSNTLHRKFLAVASGTKHARRPAMIKRYAVLFTYLAALLLSISVIPKLLNSLIPAPTGNLVFNKAASHIESYIHIPGHFWQELTSSECQAVFPGLTQQFDITATANFQSHGESATLFNIEAHGQSPSGLKTYIQVSPGNIKLDYKFESDVTTSDVLGTPVMAGYFETKQDSKGLGKIIYFAYFDLSDAAYYVELSGEKLDNEYLKNDISQLIWPSC